MRRRPRRGAASRRNAEIESPGGWGRGAKAGVATGRPFQGRRGHPPPPFGWPLRVTKHILDVVVPVPNVEPRGRLGQPDDGGDISHVPFERWGWLVGSARGASSTNGSVAGARSGVTHASAADVVAMCPR